MGERYVLPPPLYPLERQGTAVAETKTDRLVGVPNTEPPLPVDFLPRPTHPVTHVPYHVAQYWETGIRQRTEEKTAGLAAARKRHQRQTGSATGLGAGEVSREVRDSAKRTPVVRTWVRELEEPVRRFVCGRRDGEEDVEEGEEEMLFTGRKEREGGWKSARRETGDGHVEAGMVFEPLADDEAAAVKYVAHGGIRLFVCANAWGQTMACARHIGLLRPRLQVRHRGEPGPACGVPLPQGEQALEHEAAAVPAPDVGGVLEARLSRVLGLWRYIKVYMGSLDLLWACARLLRVLGIYGHTEYGYICPLPRVSRLMISDLPT